MHTVYSYTYDAAGNRATMTENGTTTTYTYDENNRLLRESKPGSTITYTYDANGNLLTGDGATYTYDARNRQVGYVKGSDFATYTYYPSGLRKTKTTALAISNYIWDGSNMICEYANSATSGYRLRNSLPVALLLYAAHSSLTLLRDKQEAAGTTQSAANEKEKDASCRKRPSPSSLANSPGRM